MTSQSGKKLGQIQLSNNNNENQVVIKGLSSMRPHIFNIIFMELFFKLYFLTLAYLQALESR